MKTKTICCPVLKLNGVLLPETVMACPQNMPCLICEVHICRTLIRRTGIFRSPFHKAGSSRKLNVVQPSVYLVCGRMQLFHLVELGIPVFLTHRSLRSGMATISISDWNTLSNRGLLICGRCITSILRWLTCHYICKAWYPIVKIKFYWGLCM